MRLVKMLWVRRTYKDADAVGHPFFRTISQGLTLNRGSFVVFVIHLVLKTLKVTVYEIRLSLLINKLNFIILLTR